MSPAVSVIMTDLCVISCFDMSREWHQVQGMTEPKPGSMLVLTLSVAPCCGLLLISLPAQGLGLVFLRLIRFANPVMV